uniref:Uncharacterized protein n=1 Tax=Ditylenchus dipsaci TaxID=166011 RepID=A0A915E575_9BILA
MTGFCTKRSIWILAFLLVLVVAFTTHLIAVLSPSWQYVYLEDGRTEHHHGLWLDCKRDYSNDYGRPRDYYEKLYRIADLQGPFDQFFLPAFYWYEHGYDENRLWGDAYQHLFLGWKIAALTAHCFALICSVCSLVLLFWAFCHRLLLCVAAVLVTLSVITSLAGNVIFYMFASYQDNNIIKEEDGIYEQFFGWSFYASAIGNVLLLVASVVGCFATTAILSSGRTKLVKIEMDEGDDNARLIHIQTSAQDLGPDRFKRSYSAVYKIDSASLRKWERNAMRSVGGRTDFKRINSMPNFKKEMSQSSRDFPAIIQSNSNISKAFTEPTHQFIPSSHRKQSASAPEPQPMISAESGEGEEMIYEYVDDQNSLAYNSTLRLSNQDGLNAHTFKHSSNTTINNLSDSSSLRRVAQDHQQQRQQQMIDEAANHSAKIKAFYERELYERQLTEKITTSFGVGGLAPTDHQQQQPATVLSEKIAFQPLFTSRARPVVPPKPPQRSPHLLPSAPSLTYKPSKQQEGIPINTFQMDSTANNRQTSRSITNLVDLEVIALQSVLLTDMRACVRVRYPLHQIMASTSPPVSSRPLKEEGQYAASEMDRSMGSTFAANSPAGDMFVQDQDQGNTYPSPNKVGGSYRTMV